MLGPARSAAYPVRSMEQHSTPASIMDRLRIETRELHTYAETRPLQKALIKGSLPRETYVEYLGQMLLVHAALEGEIRKHTSSHRAFAAVWREYQEREGNLRADLESLGVDPVTIEPLPATRATVEMIERASHETPMTLLGMLYVLEGSTNGSRFIARAIARAYNLEPGPGLSYLDPYGEKQTALWQQFKDDMNSVGFENDEMDALVESAKHMFQAIADISDDLYATVPA